MLAFLGRRHARHRALTARRCRRRAALRDGGRRGLRRPARRRCCSAACARAGPALRRRRHRRAADGRAGLRGLVAARQAGGARLRRGAAPLPRAASASATSSPSGCWRERPDVFIGVDAPDFNLDLEARLKAARHQDGALRQPVDLGLARQAHREDRARRSTTCCACSRSSRRCYAKHGIAATYVGHPLADAIPLEVPRAASARGAGPGRRRRGRRAAAGQPALRDPVHRAAPVRAPRRADARAAPGPALRAAGGAGAAPPGRAAAHACTPSDVPIELLDGRSHEALAACDVTLIASGTATLEAALFKRPMVIAYAMHALSWQMMKRMSYQPWVGLPNILLRRLRRARAAAGRGDAASAWPTPRSPGSTTRRAAPRCRSASRAAPSAAPRHRRAGHRCDRRSFSRAEQLGLRFDVPGLVAGVDEAGRGPLAGPVVAAAVILDDLQPITRPGRLQAAHAAQRASGCTTRSAPRRCAARIAEASVEEIDRLNILQATMLAMRRAVEGLRLKPAQGAGRRQPPAGADGAGRGHRARATPRCRRSRRRRSSPRCTATGCASTLHEQHPQYGFDGHKGYPTPEHLAALRAHGACPEHRRSFAPVRDVLAADDASPCGPGPDLDGGD